MAIGIDFVLRATTAGFTKGIAAANNSIHDLKKNLKAGDVGNGLKQLLGAGAIIQGFRTAINHAQELRDTLESMGRPIDATTTSVAHLGDSLDALKSGLLEAGTGFLGMYTRAGDMFGSIINEFRFGPQAEMIEKASAEFDKAEAKRKKKKEEEDRKNVEANTPEAKRAAQKALQDEIDKGDDRHRTEQEKLVRLMAEQKKLENEAIKLRDLNDAGKLPGGQAAVIAANLALAKKDNEVADLQAKADEKKVKLLEAQSDAFLPSIEDLALFQGGTNTGDAGQNLKGQKARDARAFFTLQMQSRAAYQNGDLAAALSLSQQADQARFGLLGAAKSDEVNKGKDLYDVNDRSLTELEKLNAAFRDIFVVKGK